LPGGHLQTHDDNVSTVTFTPQGIENLKELLANRKTERTGDASPS